jgi:hypothetical protein
MSELFPQSAHEYEVSRIAAALANELPDAPPETLPERAAAFVAIADRYEVPFEALIAWVHYRGPKKEWSLAECRRWCETYVETARALQFQPQPRAKAEEDEENWQLARCGHCGDLLETAAAAAAHVCRKTCKNCAHEMRRGESGRWVCTNCGEEV